LNYQ